MPIRIHVNGTRGKSTVTRLIAAALREAGIPTVAKTTGTAPRLILPDGSERPVIRRAPASIREQAWLVGRAARAGARALVAECMAVQPDLQWVSEREMLRATIGVITNVRLDHTEAMGRTLDQIAQSLANSVPRGGVLVTGDRRVATAAASRCAALGTRLVVVAASGDFTGPGREESGKSRPDPIWVEDARIALAVTRELGIADAIAVRGMQKAAADPGAVTRGVATIGERQVAWIDATAANDPESLDLLITGLKPCSTSGHVEPDSRDGPAADHAAPAATDVAQDFSPVLTIYNHRADRSDRLRIFAQCSTVFRHSGQVVVTGDRPSLSLMTRARQLCPGIDIRFVPRRRLAAATGAILSAFHVPPSASDIPDAGPGGDDPMVIFCGNTRGFVRPFSANVDTGHRTPDSGQIP
jgi:hypothetical protein